jgi:hypothetical protein
MKPVDESRVRTFLVGQPEVAVASDRVAEIMRRDESISDYSFRQLTRSAFRRSRLDDQSEHDLRQKLEAAVADGRPIALTVPFGGYKNVHAGSFPGPDWAEVFNINYLARYVLPIAQHYEPGIEVLT